MEVRLITPIDYNPSHTPELVVKAQLLYSGVLSPVAYFVASSAVQQLHCWMLALLSVSLEANLYNNTTY